MKNSSRLGGSVVTILCIALGAHAAAPVVTNVVASQRSGTKLIDIRYDVFDADADPLKIRIEISHNGGSNYSVPAITLSGDVGNNITPGTNKLIVWNAAVDWDGEYSPLMRVKVIASDSHGYPGLQWGQEVPPGGFLMGQDSGPEGVGTAKHVNIPYSYWLSKYEITVGQYADFLNTALASGEVSRSGNNILANQFFFPWVAQGSSVYALGNDIEWNLNKLVVLAGRTNLPVVVGWHGALMFARHYGYDLPTDAEWEKAARGADHDGLGEHQIYPWGNSISGFNANYRGSGDPNENATDFRTPVGFYDGIQSAGPDMANAYGLYDLIGNVAEWTRTSLIPLENYPATESPNSGIHEINQSLTRVSRGGDVYDGATSLALKCYTRANGGSLNGFRVARRSP